MPPAVALLEVETGRWSIPIPLPVVLLWPLIGLALGSVTLIERASGRAVERARLLLLAVCRLRGLEVDVRTSTGTRVFLWLA